MSALIEPLAIDRDECARLLRPTIADLFPFRSVFSSRLFHLVGIGPAISDDALPLFGAMISIPRVFSSLPAKLDHAPPTAPKLIGDAQIARVQHGFRRRPRLFDRERVIS